MVAEITVTVKDDEKTLKRKFLHYPEDGTLRLTHDDANLLKMVDQTRHEFEGQADDVVLKITMVW